MTRPILVVLPSYNESENIAELIKDILAVDPTIEVCVVDDNSPDGTADVVKKTQTSLAKPDRVHLIVRNKKDGRGGAIRKGLEWGVEQVAKNYEYFIEMDCDYSHNPKDIPRGLALLHSNSVVLGARYPDGKIVGWPWRRRLLSFAANQLARFLISPEIYDYTNGYRFYSRFAVKILLEIEQKHRGYIYLSETLAILLKTKCKIGAFPITFINRQKGTSNTTFREVLSSLTAIFRIAKEYRK